MGMGKLREGRGVTGDGLNEYDSLRIVVAGQIESMTFQLFMNKRLE
jgi:hypothetical protein